MAKQEKKQEELHIVNVEQGRITFCVIGKTPILHNRPSEKTRQELLLPRGRKTEADKRSTLKHDPIEEFRATIYRSKTGPTLVQHVSSAFRQAMRSAALDLPGVTKAEVGRLLWVEGDRIDIYGIPQLDMRIVRQAGPARTPDVRSRAIMAEWACRITVAYTKPQLKEQAVANLLTAAGMYIGIADYRNEKGAGNYGCFSICSEDDADFQRIIATGGRAAQEAAMCDPECFNDETEELYSWFKDAVKNHRSFAPLKGTNGAAAVEEIEETEDADAAGEMS